MSTNATWVALLSAVVAPLSLAACSSTAAQPASGPTSAADASNDSANPGVDGGSNTVTQRGTLIDYSFMTPTPGATVGVLNGPMATTDANGIYSFVVPKGQPFSFFVTGDQKIKLWEQETTLSGDTDRGQTNLVSLSTEGLLKAFLTGYDSTLASFTIGLVKLSTCASTEGAIVELDPPQTGASRIYVSGGLPSSTSTYAHEGSTPSLFFYNVDPTTKVKVRVTWAAPGDAGPVDGGVAAPCTQAPYPVTDSARPTLAYTGNLQIEAGDVTSYLRVFLQ